VEGLSNRLANANAELLSTRDHRDALIARERDLVQKVEILTTDKKYLQKESEGASERARTAEAKIDRLQTKIRDLKKTKESYYEQLLSSKEKNRTDYEERLAAEVTKLREASAKEMEDIRNNSRDVYERENRSIREARESALQNLDREISRNTLLQSQIDELKLANTSSIAKQETLLAELRNEIKFKSFELERISLNFEEQMSVNRQSKIENDMLHEKLEVLKAEFSKLQADSDAKASELNLVISSEREKLSAYEELEIEYDNAIMQAGALAEHEKDLEFKSLSDTLDLGIPTAARRRVKQSLLLAQRLMKAQKEVNNLRFLVEAAEKGEKVAKAALETEKRLSACVDMPKGYLVERIRALEGDLSKSMNENENLKDNLKKALDEIDSLKLTKGSLESHLTQLLNQKQELITMRSKLAALRKENDDAKMALINMPENISNLIPHHNPSHLHDHATTTVSNASHHHLGNSNASPAAALFETAPSSHSHGQGYTAGPYGYTHGGHTHNTEGASTSHRLSLVHKEKENHHEGMSMASTNVSSHDTSASDLTKNITIIEEHSGVNVAPPGGYVQERRKSSASFIGAADAAFSSLHRVSVTVTPHTHTQQTHVGVHGHGGIPLHSVPSHAPPTTATHARDRRHTVDAAPTGLKELKVASSSRVDKSGRAKTPVVDETGPDASLTFHPAANNPASAVTGSNTASGPSWYKKVRRNSSAV
jgi:hypothetical protein